MAVRADDIAQGYLGQDASAAMTDESSHRGTFGRGIAMVELEDPRREAAPAIDAWSGAQLVEKRSVGSPSRTLVLDSFPPRV